MVILGVKAVFIGKIGYAYKFTVKHLVYDLIAKNISVALQYSSVLCLIIAKFILYNKMLMKHSKNVTLAKSVIVQISHLLFKGKRLALILKE